MNFSTFKFALFAFTITGTIVASLFGYKLLKDQSKQQVLSENTQTSLASSSPLTGPSPTEEPLPTPSLLPQPTKPGYSIAIIGDSMVDTMGESLEYLQKSLTARYPKTTFKLYNFGIGGQNVAQGLARFDQPFSYQTRNFPPLSQLKPDIIIVASFAYNPFPPHDRNRHWLTLTELVNRAKTTGSSVYMLAEIAPLQSGFGKGPGGINWPENLAHDQALHIIEQLQNAVNLSKSLGVPLIDAFDKSKISGNYGESTYVNSNDGIHPSVEGHLFMADLIATTLKFR